MRRAILSWIADRMIGFNERRGWREGWVYTITVGIWKWTLRERHKLWSRPD